MRGYCGSLALNGANQPADAHIIQREAMGVLPFDAESSWFHGPVAFSQFYFSDEPTTPLTAPVFEASPDGLLVLGDVRIDNRAELSSRIDLSASSGHEEVVLAAFRKWGQRCAEYLCGDFAFVIWNIQSKELFVCRDHLGVKPFFYCQKDGFFVFASDPAGVSAHPAISTNISDVAVARYLGEGELYDERLTFYYDIQKLPPATTMRVMQGQAREARYWNPKQVARLELGSEKEYRDHLDALLNRVISDRLPESGEVGCHLSGGLDSSAIAARTAEQLHVRSQKLVAWSWMRPPATDVERNNPEWRYSLEVAERFEIDLRFTDLTVEEFRKILLSDLLLTNDTVDLWYEFVVREQARQSNIRVLLSGWGGDQFITNHGEERHLETFLAGDFVSTLNDLRHASRRYKTRWLALLRLLHQRILSPLYRQLSQTVLPQLRPQQLDRCFLNFTHPTFKSWALTQRKPLAAYLGRSLRESQLQHVQRGAMRNRVESWAVSGARVGIEYRYPLLDRRLVEFALGLPSKFYHANGFGRYLFRRCHQSLLPTGVCWQGQNAEKWRVLDLLECQSAALKAVLESGARVGSDCIDEVELQSAIRNLPDQFSEVSLDIVLVMMACIKSVLLGIGSSMNSAHQNQPNPHH